MALRPVSRTRSSTSSFPRRQGQFRNVPGFIEVRIRSTRPSIFGGLLGAVGWDVAARAVAANQPGLDMPFSMLALDPHACRAIQVTGSGTVTSAGTVQLNSDCDPDALYVGGTGTLEVTAPGATCNAVGGISESKGKGCRTGLGTSPALVRDTGSAAESGSSTRPGYAG